MKITKRELVARISAKTGLTTYKSRRALRATLLLIQRALGDGKQVDLGKIGKLVVVTRKQKRVVQKNLKHVGPTLVDIHKKHKKTVRLLGGKDLSDNPLPTIIHEKEPEPQLPPRSKRVAVAMPAWRGHRRFR